MAQAYNHLTCATSDLGELENLFRKDHPVFADMLVSMCTGISLLQEAIQMFVIEVWGNAPDDWEQWRSNWPKKSKQVGTDISEDMSELEQE